MTDRMRQTKKELVAILQDAETLVKLQNNEMISLRSEYQRIVEQQEQLRGKIRTVMEQNQELASENIRIILEKERLENELAHSNSNHLQVQKELENILNTYRNLTDRYETLKKTYESGNRCEAENIHRSSMENELFKSFVDTDTHKILLIDTAYTICHINRSAGDHLQLPDPGIIIGRRLFDFISYQDGLRIKKKIEHILFCGEREEIRKIVFRNPKNHEFQIDIEMIRVRYRDQPSIQMIIK